MGSMKILCICERGNSRSVALAYILKDGLNQDAIAMGIRANSEETKSTLYEWADHIVLVDKTFVNEIPKEYQGKLVVWDVGPDRYFLGFHPELLDQYSKFINDNDLHSATH
jgi:predicted protein tyrosine phosphatase